MGWEPKSEDGDLLEIRDLAVTKPMPTNVAAQGHAAVEERKQGVTAMPAEPSLPPSPAPSRPPSSPASSSRRSSTLPPPPPSGSGPTQSVDPQVKRKHVIPPPRIGVPRAKVAKQSNGPSQLPHTADPPAQKPASTNPPSVRISSSCVICSLAYIRHSTTRSQMTQASSGHDAVIVPSRPPKPTMDVRQALQILRNSSSANNGPLSSEPPPKNAAEWNAFFAPYELKMRRIIEATKNGDQAPAERQSIGKDVKAH
jgi:hypothetical protein